jgi:hypothetical protein
MIHLQTTNPAFFADYVCLGLIAILSAAAYLIVVHFRRKRFIQNADDGVRKLDIPLIASLPYDPSIDTTKICSDGSFQKRAMDAIQTPLSSARKTLEASKIALVSPGQSDGKSSCALILALNFAAQKKRTLIIDTAPDTHLCKLAGIPSESLEHQSQPTKFDNVFVITYENLIATGVLDEAQDWFHHIVLDTGATLHSKLPFTCVDNADVVCLVIRRGRTLVSEAIETIQLLRSQNIEITGFILNGA